jgi:hypothetical protein
MVLGLLVTPWAIAAEPATVGEVTSLSGQVNAVRQGAEPRALSCGDPVFEGESVVTSPGSGAGVLLAPDLLAEVGEKSSLRLARTTAGAPDATLERGAVRVIDARQDPTPARLAAGSAAARVDGGDSEAYLLAEKAGGYSMFCEWDSPLAVERGNETRTAKPEQCVISKPHEPLYVADAHEDRMPAGPDGCPPAAVAAAGPHFGIDSAQDVAAGPPPAGFLPGPIGLSSLAREPCEDPGSICARVQLDEAPPGTDPSPGGGGTFPGVPPAPQP